MSEAEMSSAEVPRDLVRRGALSEGLAVLERGARAYPSNQSCFACYHQTLPILAMTAARRCGDSDSMPNCCEIKAAVHSEEL